MVQLGDPALYGNEEARLDWASIMEETILCLHVNATNLGVPLSE